MSIVVVTGSSGLIGSEAVKLFHGQGLDVVGIDNNMRGYFFGASGSTDWKAEELRETLRNYTHLNIDIRDEAAIFKLFGELGPNIVAIVHAAAQPSHDWAAKEPFTDFTINANGTMTMLEATRRFSPEATFVLTSTNKVYGDTPNALPLVEGPTRWEIDAEHRFYEHGIDESMSIDQSKHSLFGVSKVAADLLVQEYGRYFGMNTGVFRGGCLTGPAHSGAELHGFLAYLVKCAVTGIPYNIFGYKGKQVRDNIHSSDMVAAVWNFVRKPTPGAVYNMGGSRHSNCSVLEAIALIEELSGLKVDYALQEQAREGDHIWWISDVRKFERDYPEWRYRYDLPKILSEIIEATRERLSAA